MSGVERELNHLLIIVDGNRRYARKAGVSLAESYKTSVEKIYEVIMWACVEEGIPVVSFYVMSQYNFDRPREQIEPIFEAALYAMDMLPQLNGHVRYRVCGDLRKFPEDVRERLQSINGAGESNDRLVNLLIGYSGDIDKANAAVRCMDDGQLPLDENLLQHSSLGPVPIDVCIRTGGVIRLSDGPVIGIKQTRFYEIDDYFPELKRETFAQTIDAFRTGRKI